MMSNNTNYSANKKTWYLHSVAGAISGASTRLVCQPFDVIKIRFQLQVEPISKKSNGSKYKSIYQSISVIYREEGIRAFWKGHLPGQILSTTFGLTQFVVFQKSLAYLSTSKEELNKTSSTHFICGVTATFFATLSSYPFDVVRTRLVAQKSNQIYLNMRQATISIFRNEGLLAWYRGLLPTLLQNSLQGGFIFMFYNIISKEFLTNTSTNKTFHDDYFNSVKQFCSGFLSGMMSKTFVYPLDVIKKRLQLQDFIHFRNGFGSKFMCSGSLDCVCLTLKNESISGLYKGLSPSLIKAGFVTALHLTLYEQIYKLLCSFVENV